MNLYLLRRKDPIGYDQVVGFVIAAPSPSAARAWAVGAHADEPYKTWRNPDLSSCTVIGTAKRSLREGIVLRSFRAG